MRKNLKKKIKKVGKGINKTAKYVNGFVSTRLVKPIEKVTNTINEKPGSIYDKAVDAVYNKTHIGGGKLHRLLDGNHSPINMWFKVKSASPHDTFKDEVKGYFKALFKDMSSPVGIPVVNINRNVYNGITSVASTFGLKKEWVIDMLHVNLPEFIGAGVGTAAFILTKKDDSLHGSLIVSSFVGGNPLLLGISSSLLTRKLLKKEINFKDFTKGAVCTTIALHLFSSLPPFISIPAFIIGMSTVKKLGRRLTGRTQDFGSCGSGSNPLAPATKG